MNDKGKQVPGSERLPNAWLVSLDHGANLDDFTIRLNGEGHDLEAISDGDGLLIVAMSAGGIVAFARVYRTHISDVVALYFDGVLRVSAPISLPSVGVISPAPIGAIG